MESKTEEKLTPGEVERQYQLPSIIVMFALSCAMLALHLN